jgi:hypothetical protein
MKTMKPVKFMKGGTERPSVSEGAARTEWGERGPASERVGGAAGAKPPGLRD